MRKKINRTEELYNIFLAKAKEILDKKNAFNFNNKKITVLDENAIKFIATSATLKYLEIWLTNSTSSNKKIYTFVSEGLSREEYDNAANRCKAFYHASYLLNNNINLQNKLARNVNKKYKRLRYHRDTPQLFNGIQLRFMEAYADGYLLLYKYLFKCNPPLFIKSIQIGLDPVRIGYDEYFNYIHRIKEFYLDGKYKDFTESYLFLRNFESTYQFLLVAKLAKYLIDNNLSIHHIPFSLKCCFQCLPSRETSYINPYIMDHCDTLIDLAFGTNHYEFFSSTIYLVRHMIYAVLSQTLPLRFYKWTDENYKDAADFIFNNQNILCDNIFKDLKNTSDSKSQLYYGTIRFLYNSEEFISKENYALAQGKLITPDKRTIEAHKLKNKK